MRILLTADPILAVPPRGYGGIERIVAALIREYRSLNHRVALVAKTGSDATVDELFTWPGENVSGKLDTWKNAWALRRAVKVFKPDVVHSFSRLAYLGPLLPARVAKVMSYQRVVGARQVRWARRFSRKTLRFTGCSEYIAALGRRGGGKWRAIPNFVEVEKYTFIPGVARDAPLVFLSRVESIKGPHLAIAIARQAGRRLILAGNRASDGPEAAYFEREIAPHLDRDGIQWIGEVDDAQKNALLGQAAALLVPVQWDEPFGIVFVEALATGCPIITCARGALPEIVTPGRTGLFIQNAADGVSAVNGISTLDRAACRADAVNQFSSRVCAEQYLALYSEMNTPVHE